MESDDDAQVHAYQFVAISLWVGERLGHSLYVCVC